MKTAFLEIENISTVKGHIDKLVNKNISNSTVEGVLEIDISYRDMENNECFKSMPVSFSVELNDLAVHDVELKKLDVYVVDCKGVDVEYILSLVYEENTDKPIEIIELNPQEEVALPQEEKIEQIKKDISQDYENKLADNLNQREKSIAIVTTKEKESPLDFLKFFDNTIATYYSIKTLSCPQEEMLNQIAKEYNVPLEDLLKGYDKENGKVTFRLIK